MDELDQLLQDLTVKPKKPTEKNRASPPAPPQAEPNVDLSALDDLDSVVASLKEMENPPVSQDVRTKSTITSRVSLGSTLNSSAKQSSSKTTSANAPKTTPANASETPPANATAPPSKPFPADATTSPKTSPSKPMAPPSKTKSSFGSAHFQLDAIINSPGRSVTTSREPMCDSCQLPIETGYPVEALGRFFHPEHFQCKNCQTPLSVASFFEHEGQPWCERCINNFVLPKCAYCSEAIKGKCINALENTWHPEHFFCSQCGKQFPAGAAFMENDGKAYCEDDYNSIFAPKCAACDDAITSQVISALGKSYHHECFVCTEQSCQLSLAGSGMFFDFNGDPYCEQHYHIVRGSMCGSCQKPIIGRCITAFGKKFHPEHFICTHCTTVLNIGTGKGSTAFKERSGRPFCMQCFMKLYG